MTAIVCDHQPLVRHLVRDMLSRLPVHVRRDDLISAGMLALVQAARSFDETQGVPFSGFATRRIRGALLDELRSMDWASRSVRRRARALDAVRADLATTLGRAPTRRETAVGSGLSVDELLSNERDLAMASVGSLQALNDADETIDLTRSAPEPIDVLLHREQLAYVVDAVEQLPPRLRTVISGYFLEQRPMCSLAAELGVTESRISQMRAEGLALLRHALTELLDGAPKRSDLGAVAQRRRDEYVLSVAAVRPPRARLAYRPEVELSSIA